MFPPMFPDDALGPVNGTYTYICDCMAYPHRCDRTVEIPLDDADRLFAGDRLLIIDGCPNPVPTGYLLESIYPGFRVYVHHDDLPKPDDRTGTKQ